jgi:hypothetical protein
MQLVIDGAFSLIKDVGALEGDLPPFGEVGQHRR